MKFSEIIIFSAAVATASAGPMKRSAGNEPVDITFIAPDAQFTQSFPTDGSSVDITNPLSISHISSSTDGVTCTFEGIDQGETTVTGAQYVDVGPPQTQVSGHCTKLWRRDAQPQRRGSVTVDFIGAADAHFEQTFPTDGTSTVISNVLSISHIEIDVSGVHCTFNGVDKSVTDVYGPGTVDVGPPQTQVEGRCWA
ncbi:hypothetical protein N7532_003817 [Penicillium argentinense]|uniref:Uncharacterized protein n=1 Tax=Penicillium argentinense TaxID=1131581 RepID=A0A9W9KF16_9EURO|nr:uncharacterized protein N7532_003817 [Penicillium argentinense]KAJ5103288.1 hypothetical protein N7532_003817 [Penicillium argentinense]